MARYEQYIEVSRLRNGSVMWAYEFELNSKKEHPVLNCTPVKGRICVSPICFNEDERHVFNPERAPRMFVPFKKNSETEYAWSRAVSLHARCYADTETEAIEGYNQRIQKCIDWHNERIAELKEKQIQGQVPV